MQAIEVEAHWDEQGQPWPRRIDPGGRRLAVTGVGRRWQAEDGEHILCQVAGRRIFELIYQAATGRWQVDFQTPERKAV